MGSACGVSWDGTASGKLDESEIPDPPDHKSHYVNAADTKSDSSFPVVDGDGNLRAGNVNAAWDLRNRGDGVSKECLRKFDAAFDDDVLPDTAYENSMTDTLSFAEPPEWEEGQMVMWVANPDMVGRIVHNPDEENILMVDLMEEVDGEWESTGYTLTAGYTDVRPMDEMDYSETTTEFGMNVRFSAPTQEALTEGFNRYGVRENEDGSLDVRFDAMEPGVRRGIEVTPEFLRRTTRKDYDRIPLQLDHSDSQRANVGYIEPENIQFTDVLQVQAHIPNTGSDVRNDVIADFKHEPPQITDISVSFATDSIEIDAGKKRSDTPKFVDGRFREFSLTPFPAGYDNGGLTPAFSSAIDDALDGAASASTDSDSGLVKRPHTLIEK